MSSQISLPKNPILVISQNESKERTYNDEIYPSLLGKKRYYESRFNSYYSDNADDTLSYRTFHPFQISINRKSQLKMSKEALNKMLIESSQKRQHRDIYNTKLFFLINPYHIVVEKRYINPRYISDEIQAKFEEEKKEILEREYNLSPYEFYDKNNQIYFGFVSKRNKLFKERNNILIKKAVKKNDILVRIKNQEDCFDKNFLLNPDFKISELKSLIAFIYKTKLYVENPGKISLYYNNDTFSQINIENDNETLEDIGKQMKNQYVLDIFINTVY